MLITLQQIRDKSPCTDGWKKLLTSLGNPSDLSMQVSFGDIAKSNDAQDALWCLRCIDDRLFATSLVLPAVKRVSKHNDDKRVHDCIALLERFVNGSEVTQVEFHDAADAERNKQAADIIELSPLHALKGA